MRLFTLYFAVAGLLVFAALSDALGTLFFEGSEVYSRWAHNRRERRGQPHKEYFVPLVSYEYFVRPYQLLIGFVLLQYGSAALFANLEGWEFFDALYHCLMTATTIGLGEYGPVTDGVAPAQPTRMQRALPARALPLGAPTATGGRIFAFFHILVTVIFFGTFLGSMAGRFRGVPGDSGRETVCVCACVCGLDVDVRGRRGWRALP
jgi:hypothetical protein